MTTPENATEKQHAAGQQDEAAALWSRHPLLASIVWLLGGDPNGLKKSSSSTSTNSSSSSLKENGGRLSWSSRDSLRISESDATPLAAAAAAPSTLTPKVLQGSSSSGSHPSSQGVSPSWGWYVSTGTTPQQQTPSSAAEGGRHD